MDRILRLPQVLELTGLSRISIWRMQKAGRFPKCFRLGDRAVGWKQSEIEVWMENLERGNAPAPVQKG